jgi:hypothetical protein
MVIHNLPSVDDVSHNNGCGILPGVCWYHAFIIMDRLTLSHDLDPTFLPIVCLRRRGYDIPFNCLYKRW